MINSTSPRVSHQDMGRAKLQLKDHQLAMVKKSLDIENGVYKQIFAQTQKQGDVRPIYQYGVMSAPVGSGKTYCVLGMCLLDKFPINNVTKEQSALFDYMKRLIVSKPTEAPPEEEKNLKESKNQVLGATLIVVPSHLFTQWRTSIAAFTSDLRVQYFEDYGDINTLYYKTDGLLNTDVFLVSSLYYQTVATTLQTLNVTFRRLVFDEADSMVNMLAYAAPATVTWFVSSSIKQLVGPSGLKVSDKYVVPLAHLERNLVDCDLAFIKQGFGLPDIEFAMKTFEDPGLDAISTVIDKDFRKMLYACDTHGVQYKMFKKVKQVQNSSELATALTGGWKALIDKRNNDMDCVLDDEKPAVLREIDDLNGRIAVLAGLPASLDDGFVKLKFLCELCVENTKKLLIFSEFPAVLLKLEEFLQDKKIKYVDCEGGTKEKMAAAIKKYNCDDVNIMLIHSMMFSCGMNLENTDHLVVTHNLSPALRQQVIGRAQRPGRTGPLLVTDMRYVNENQK